MAKPLRIYIMLNGISEYDANLILSTESIAYDELVNYK